jgi:type 1 glutamine amidotransferase
LIGLPIAMTASMARAQSDAPFKVLALFNAGYDAAHISYSHESNAFFPNFAKQNNFQYDSSKDWSKLNDPNLINQYKVVMFLDDQPPSSARAGFQKYMEAGGGWIGYHVCAFTTNSAEWDWYHNKFLCKGNFKSNTWGPTPAQMKVEDPAHAVTKGFPAVFKSETSEWYNWTVNPRNNPDIKILCSIDKSSYPLGTDPNQSWTSGDNPIVWTNTKYKMIYCNSGHNDMDYAANKAKSLTWSNTQHCQLILNALNWMAGRTPTATSEYAPQSAPELRISMNAPSLTISRSGAEDFGIAILDLQGNTLARGRAAQGSYSIEKDRLGKGVFVIQTRSAAGMASKTLSLR